MGSDPHPPDGRKVQHSAALLRLGERRLHRVQEVNQRFFAMQADAVSEACWDMAKRFHRVGRLLVFGSGASESDAYHVAVEFLHPVMIGKPALPAMVLKDDAAARLRTVGKAADIAFGIASGGQDARVSEALRTAKGMGLLTVALSGGRPLTETSDHAFVVPDDDPLIVQEVQETCCHVIHELVHVFLEHEGLL